MLEKNDQDQPNKITNQKSNEEKKNNDDDNDGDSDNGGDQKKENQDNQSKGKLNDKNENNVI